MDLKNRIDKLRNIALNLDTFSIYDYKDENIQMLLSRFKTKINETVEVSNNTLTLAEWLVNEGLSKEVSLKLEEMEKDGTLENIINESLFTGLNDKIDDVVNTSLTNKDDIMNIKDDIFINKTLIESSQSEIDTLKVSITKSIFDYGVEGSNITNAIDKFLKDVEAHTLFIPNGNYDIYSQIVVGSNKHIFGESLNTIIHYRGIRDNVKSMFIIGQNTVGKNDTELENYGLNSTIKNLRLIGHNLIGFGVYGAYLGDNILVDNVVVQETTEYAMYFARAWYPRFTNLVAHDNMGIGLAFGVPLILRDGTNLSKNWTGADMYNLNTCYIENVRANFCGKAGDYIEGTNHNGYGLGLGSGNGFFCTNFLSENNRGYGVYSYLNNSQVHKIENGYIERNCMGAKTNYAIFYEVKDYNTKFIEASNIYLNEEEAKIWKCGDDVTGGAFTIKNISYGNGFFTDDTKGTGIASIENCYWKFGDTTSYQSQGYMVCTYFLPMIGKNEDDTSNKFYLPVAYTNDNIRNLCIVGSDDLALSGQIILTNSKGSKSWRTLKSCGSGQIVNLGSLYSDTIYLEFESDCPIEQKVSFGIYEYTGIKPIRN